MIQALTGLQWAVALALVLLGAVTLRDWLRNHDRTRLWLATAVNCLALVGLLGRISGVSGAPAVLLQAVDLVLFMGSAFAFVLFRDSLIPSRRNLLRASAAIAVVLCVAAFIVSVGMTTSGNQSRAATGLGLSTDIALLLTWAALVGSSVIRLARASGALPSVQRARLRALNAGFTGLVIAVVGLALTPGLGQDKGFQVAVEAVVLLCMPLLGAALSPPSWLRRVWREREETEYRHAINELLLYSPDAVTLAKRGIEWAARLLGARSALIALDSRVVATEGLGEDDAQSLHGEMEGRRTLGEGSFVSSLGPTALVPINSRAGDGYLAVVAGPFTPLFGDEERARLSQYAVSMMVALDRVHLSEGIRRNAELLDLAYDAVFTWEFSTRAIQYWNKAATDLYGFSEQEAVGADPQKLLSSVYPVPLDAIVAALCEYGHWEGELVQRSKGGQVIPISARWALMRDSEGNPTSVLEINRDVTAEKKAADSLRRARDAAEQASSAKSEYLSRMSHELRTPLAAMLGFSDLLEMREPRDDQVQAIDAIQRAGSHLLSLVNDVLDIARIESGRENLSLQPVDVRAALDECTGLVAAAASARGMAISIRADATEMVFVTADRQRLNQVLLNLLSNAIKYGAADGRVEVAVTATASDVTIDVIDDGPGISEAEQELLFQPFERLGAERTDVQGTGLGLALARQLTTAMGGNISVSSVLGEGSVFSIRLQRAAGTDATARVRASTRSMLSDPVMASTVLYVEDNLATISLVESIFALRPNIRLITAMQGMMAVELAHQQQPDLIILDLHLPDINGEEVLNRLRDDARTAEIPVVMYTADATERQVDRLLAAGVAAYLTKPARVSEFLGMLDRVLAGDVHPEPYPVQARTSER